MVAAFSKLYGRHFPSRQIHERLLELEKTTALAWLDTMDRHDPRAETLSKRIFKAESEGKHYRIVRKREDRDEYFVLELHIEVEEGESDLVWRHEK